MRGLEDLKKEVFEEDPELKKAYDVLGFECGIVIQILQKRIEKGFSQKQLAKKVGTKHSAIARLEGGNSNPSVAFLEKVAKALGGKLQITLS